MKDKLYKILLITDKNNNPRMDGRYPQRINSICSMYSLEKGHSAIFEYISRDYKPYSGFLKTSIVQNIRENNSYLYIETMNSIYMLQELDSNINDILN